MPAGLRDGFRGWGVSDRSDNPDVMPLSYLKNPGTGAIKSGTPLILSSGSVFVERAALTAGVNEVNTLTYGGTVTGGTFTLSFTGSGSTQTTTALAWNSTAFQVQEALQALSNIGPGNVLVTGGPGPGTPFVLTFRGLLASRVITTIVVNSSLAGTSPTLTAAKTTSGTQGRISSAAIFGFAENWDNAYGPMGSSQGTYGGYDLAFGRPIINLEGYPPVVAGALPPNEADQKPIIVQPAGGGKIFYGRVAHDVTVTNALIGTTVDIGWNPDFEDFYIAATTVVPLATIIRIPPEEVGRVGGIVEFVIQSARLQASLF